MHFIKLGKKYINLDNVTIIEPKSDLEMDMADIRREREKVKMLQNIDKIVINNPPEDECVG